MCLYRGARVAASCSFEPGRVRGDPGERPQVRLVQALGELLDKLPDRGALGTVELPSPPGTPGPEVLLPGGDDMPEHDLGPLVVQESGVPAALPQLQQHLTPQLDGLVVVHEGQPGAWLCLVDDPDGELVDVDHVHPVEELGAAEQQQPLPQVAGEVLVERREQHVLA